MADEESAERPTFSERIVRGRSIDVSQWATPDVGAMPDSRQALYFARKRAVEMYLSNASSESIKRATSLSAKHAYRLISERCLETHQDGRAFGWRGLVPYERIRPYRRIHRIRVNNYGGGAAGAMQTLLDANPELRAAFDDRILTIPRIGQLTEIKRARTRHHSWFLDQLRVLGYELREEWPFNTVSLGYFSIRRYVEKVLLANPKAMAHEAGGPDLVKKLATGDGVQRPVTRFMQRVEMDAHKTDGRFCVLLPQIGGGFVEKIVHRIWVVVLLEVVSRAVIGYYVSLAREVSKEDVLRAIKRALTPWELKPVTFCDEAYLPGAGLLSTLGPEYVGLCWDETSVDGALAETCHQVRSALEDVVGAKLLEPSNSFSRRRSKDDRPFIESFFRHLGGKGFQRLSNTTGSKPEGRKGRDPEAVALTCRFQYEYAEELLDALIANYNVQPHSGIGNRTPLEYAKFLYRHTASALRHVDSTMVDSMFSVRKLCTVKGGARAGRRPYVAFFNATYSNETLGVRHDLVGSKIWVIAHHEDDARTAMGVTMDGTPLGVLRAAPPWNGLPHSIAVRTAICQANRVGKFRIPPGADPVEALVHYCESQADKKLPVHPAYLAARRILTTAAAQSVGDVMLETALSRADEVVHSPGNPHQAEGGVVAKPAETKPPRSPVPLPPRRIAVTRS
ncbi:hypothetical protein [Burkholderia cenocepacia]|uniref:hypothetical protein n=1 Tax=Burkholderia cenocepacia TaxID=95486 RepID=UPI00222FF7A4|nr:hypothetical protein [Burkholderia cenocepacia]MCW3503605.1 hypothetical protein [Burkholderia cenocepacia]MCW3510958.1 hypothetical protein [Burkholderia cenocepacia]MCW3518782.1 hypothetical protein [Burkholderia cenocepacia]MCW3533941.1 hypothetical protein [Burkholderia cenocepacia]MCW3549123.1 hypothetical protein [Burkholderia cenocepacia]